MNNIPPSCFPHVFCQTDVILVRFFWLPSSEPVIVFYRRNTTRRKAKIKIKKSPVVAPAKPLLLTRSVHKEKKCILKCIQKLSHESSLILILFNCGSSDPFSYPPSTPSLYQPVFHLSLFHLATEFCPAKGDKRQRRGSKPNAALCLYALLTNHEGCGLFTKCIRNSCSVVVTKQL